MTPAARVQTAIELLDDILDGAPAERCLTGWARGARFAGSKDRAAIRDHVYDVLRQRRSLAALGGGETGRALMLGLLRQQGVDPEQIFTGLAYAPTELTEAERAQAAAADDVIDMPAWLIPQLEASLGGDFAPVMAAMKQRAPVILRANLRKANRDAALAALAAEGILGTAHAASPTAIEITEGARKIRNSAAYRDGLIELQDAASQAAIDLLPLRDDMRVLDYCAGGGGKLLAMAGRSKAAFFAHDAIAVRLRDLPARAKRAGVNATVCDTGTLKGQQFDLVFCDVPCSGSGTWRRDPDAKWRFAREDLDAVTALQAEIMDEAAALVAPGGALAYATCSLLDAENVLQIKRFLATHPGWQLAYEQRWTPLEGCDGFFTALLRAP
ncbi:RsmB/NOP family class I SAM-dependent RNA methyltransferase [Cognatishimia sp. SS12]|uniref:RsmB/NOP family class I SAM-dependent RNA methyltransferase n=1 Tax=Cognatishimia sp. SS12 TaxID=2979465 RepID=UPI00232E105F|nr:RsmB/NOP family class I SAM-dependent RNA methyltransferase [Cognatishimia sp. SS12]MDC0737274.1 RsmB/NOP family class I SAM-dependent RNA methyltransferase [Cognatishimia sp. SS12]